MKGEIVFGSEALEVAIGLALVFFVLAAASSAVVELIASWLKIRARHLRRSLKRLMAGTKDVPTQSTGGGTLSPEQQNANAAVALVNQLYKSSPIAPLAAAAKDQPSYIPAKNFAEGVLSIVRRGMEEQSGDAAANDYATQVADNETALEESLNLLPDNLRL